MIRGPARAAQAHLKGQALGLGVVDRHGGPLIKEVAGGQVLGGEGGVLSIDEGIAVIPPAPVARNSLGAPEFAFEFFQGDRLVGDASALGQLNPPDRFNPNQDDYQKQDQGRP